MAAGNRQAVSWDSYIFVEEIYIRDDAAAGRRKTKSRKQLIILFVDAVGMAFAFVVVRRSRPRGSRQEDAMRANRARGLGHLARNVVIGGLSALSLLALSAE